MADDEDGVKERLARMEERLIAEKSVRKTRDDQLFKFISQVHRDMENQGKSLSDISAHMQKVESTLNRVENTLDDQGVTIKAVSQSSQENRDSIKEIDGSVKAIKWIWPIILTLLGVAFTLLVANVDLKINQAAGQDVEKQEIFDTEKILP